MEGCDLTSCHAAQTTSSFLDLPEAALREVLSWSPNGATANALLNTCTSLRRVRRDAAAAALLLMRCSCRNYWAALRACAGCEGGTAAVVQQVLQRVQASPDCGGPLAAPAPLLQAMLFTACAAGDEPHVRALLALQSPPDARAEGSRALMDSLKHGPYLAVATALLEAGADPCARHLHIVAWAAQRPGTIQALSLLLRHCPAIACATATVQAVHSAIVGECEETLACLLPAGDAAGVDWVSGIIQAASAGGAGLLRVLLDHHTPSVWNLGASLAYAATGCCTACVALLLDRGADPNHGEDVVAEEPQLPLVRALMGPPAGAAPVAEGDRRETVALLRRRGAVVTEAVREKARQFGRSYLLAPDVLAEPGAARLEA